MKYHFIYTITVVKNTIKIFYLNGLLLCTLLRAQRSLEANTYVTAGQKKGTTRKWQIENTKIATKRGFG